MPIFSKLLDGYARFRNQYTQGQPSRMQELSGGQQPEIVVIACSDSRVDPAVLLQCDPGDLFMIRNVANIVPPYDNDEHCHGVSTALEYATRHLKVKHIIIMGHSQCGGINAMKHGCDGSDFIDTWVDAARPAGDLPDSIDECAKAVLHESYQNCLSFPWIKSEVDNGTLLIHRWFFDLSSGTISWYNLNKKDFTPLNEDVLQNFT